MRNSRRVPDSKYAGELAAFYDLDHQWRDYSSQARLVRTLALPPGARILDVCCGSGSHAVLLARKGFRVTGVDQSGSLLAQARSKASAARSRISFVKQDVFTLGRRPAFFARFDAAILLGWTLSIAAMYRRFPQLLKGVANALKPGGLFVFDVAMGAGFHPAPRRPIRYTLPTGVKGVLDIREDERVKRPLKAFLYHWEIIRLDGSPPLRVATREVLRVTKPQEIFSRLRKFSGQFELVHRLRDYRLDRPYRRGDKNLVAVLRRLDDAREQE